MIIVSSCLVGINCRYDGRHCLDEKLFSVIGQGNWVPLCPEQLGGLSTPRPPAYIVSPEERNEHNGSSVVCNTSGDDVTAQFIRGAREVVRIASFLKIDMALMKEYSPSCGVRYIKRNGAIIGGMGITSSCLLSEGITVVSSEMWDEDYVRYYCSR
jgi:uncharacterized protein YbbK (DUF523 family)